MKLADFEKLGEIEYNRGFHTALITVVKLLAAKICEDYNADGVCEHEVCGQFNDLTEGLEAVSRSFQ